MKYRFVVGANQAKKKIAFYVGVLLLSCSLQAPCQPLSPGFDAVEYNDLLTMNFVMIGDTLPVGARYKMQKGSYQKLFVSPEVGLYNKCAVFMRSDSVAIICLRGTIGKAQSWMENFYAAMVPAKGSMQLSDSTNFSYQLAADSKAMVHVGWLVGLGFMSDYINTQVKQLADRGINNIIITGHSQGGALAFLTTSYLYHKYHEAYPALRFKTYASAAPKPGNLYYAYDFDQVTGGGYGYRIINTADWVPETPLTVQTLQDFNDVSVIKDAKKILKKQKFIARLAIGHVYNRMNNAGYKTMKRYRKYLGHTVYKQASKSLPGFTEPVYSYGSNYMTAGSPIILAADDVYYSKFIFDGKDYFVHHMLKPYKYLLTQHFPQTAP
jgi:predicted lipase